jgi:hypothetical protein
MRRARRVIVQSYAGEPWFPDPLRHFNESVPAGMDLRSGLAR